MCFLRLTHPTAHTFEAVGSQRCGARGAVGGSVPCSRVSPQLWTIPAGAKIRTQTSGYKSNALSIRATTAPEVRIEVIRPKGESTHNGYSVIYMHSLCSFSTRLTKRIMKIRRIICIGQCYILQARSE